ncbi:MAG: hypothetical protein ACI39E_01085 [Acutalibacteraceae bacterium]
MKKIHISVLCTREEYIRFCGASAPKATGFAVAAAVTAVTGLLLLLLKTADTQTAVTVLLAAVLLALFGGVILPFYRKGEAARRYDESDSFSTAVSVVIEGDSLTLHGAHIDGTLPLCAVTKTVRTSEMLALQFGREVTVLLPLRAMSEQEARELAALAEKAE